MTAGQTVTMFIDIHTNPGSKPTQANAHLVIRLGAFPLGGADPPTVAT